MIADTTEVEGFGVSDLGEGERARERERESNAAAMSNGAVFGIFADMDDVLQLINVFRGDEVTHR